MRTLRLVRHLAESGWDVQVVTAAIEGIRAGTPLDAALTERIPSSVKVARARALRPIERLTTLLRPVRRHSSTSEAAAVSAPVAIHAATKSRWSRAVAMGRAVFGLPDREISWLLPAVLAGRRAAALHAPDVIYSSGPPFTAHLAAAAIARLLGKPWVADFRDPWARAPWRDDRFAFERHAWAVCERMVVSHADATIFATRANRQEFARHYGPALASRFHVVGNGCDVSEFQGLELQGDRREFVLLHAGSLYGARNPAALLKAISGAIASGAIAPATFRLRFIGRLGLPGIDLPLLVRALGLEAVVDFVPQMPRRAVLQEIVNASALLIVQPVTTVSVPGKLYEYFAAGRPVLALAEPGGETADLVGSCPGSVAVSADDEAAIQQGLIRIINQAGTMTVRPDPELYDGRLRSAEIATILRTAAAAAPSSPGAPKKLSLVTSQTRCKEDRP
jgi:glycosyltransferase involved in cell wall biosynthesis